MIQIGVLAEGLFKVSEEREGISRINLPRKLKYALKLDDEA